MLLTQFTAWMQCGLLKNIVELLHRYKPVVTSGKDLDVNIESIIDVCHSMCLVGMEGQLTDV